MNERKPLERNGSFSTGFDSLVTHFAVTNATTAEPTPPVPAWRMASTEAPASALPMPARVSVSSTPAPDAVRAAVAARLRGVSSELPPLVATTLAIQDGY